MSIVNGTVDRREEILEVMNLLGNPFTRNEPSDSAIGRVFVGREQEIRAAAMRVVDQPRNILVQGGYGYGKTTFVKKLLHELHSSQRFQFLTGYAPLRHDSPEGFQLAALAALAMSARQLASEGSPLAAFGATTLDELDRIEGIGHSFRMPDLRFRKGLALAKDAGFHRVILAVDEIDKRDPQEVLNILMGSRFFLDLEASFLLTGRPLDVLGDARSSVLAAFDHRISLHPFTVAESTEILLRNLSSVRRRKEETETMLPFEVQVADSIVERAKGLPRSLNLMAYAALEEAIVEGFGGRNVQHVNMNHLETALEQEGNIVFGEIGVEGRRLIDEIDRLTGLVAGRQLDTLLPGGLSEVLSKLDELSRKDALLHMEAVDGAAFAISPAVSRSLKALRQKRQRLQGLWQEAISATDPQARGKALEVFAAAFFDEAFDVGGVNVRTDTEEIDLVLSPSPITDARFRKSLHLFAECKNWRSQKVDQSVVSALSGKLMSHQFEQGFMLTTGAFTDEARRQAENLAMSSKIQIILLDGTMIRHFLEQQRPVSDLLVELHGRLLLRRR